MRIVFTGGGTGGHFYPIIAIVERIHEMIDERKLLEPELIYLGPSVFDNRSLVEQDIIFKHAHAASIRSYSNPLMNIIAIPTILIGIVKALFQMFALYPDVVFSTGGYAAYPTLVAARILMIPVIIYDADATPGKVSLYAAKFARWIGVAHPDAPNRFPAAYRSKIALIGHPIRREIEAPANEGAKEFLDMDQSVPTVFVLGGSQGAQAINDAITDTLTLIIDRYNIVHQTGAANLASTKALAEVLLKDNRNKEHYRAFGIMNSLALRMVAGSSSLIICRAGSGTIFEIASWGLPSILIPIPESISHDQTKNAFSYARTGAAVVLEQKNLTPHLLAAEIDRIMGSAELRQSMSEKAKAFSRPDAARKIARLLLDTALEHAPK